MKFREVKRVGPSHRDFTTKMTEKTQVFLIPAVTTRKDASKSQSYVIPKQGAILIYHHVSIDY